MLLLKVNLLQNWRRLTGVRDQSRLLISVVVAFIVGYASIAFLLFGAGLRFASRFPGLGEILVERLMFLLFACLFMMLLFSNLVIGYTNLFKNKETAALITLPIPFKTIYRWKFIETATLASWAFLFLIAPMLAAYGLHNDAEWHFYGITMVQIAMFIVIPSSVGCYLSLNLARSMDRKSFQITALAAASIILTVIAVTMRPEVVPDEIQDSRVLNLMDRLLSRTRFAQYPLLPSYWLTSGVMHWIEGALTASGFFILVTLSYVTLFGLLSFTSMGPSFYAASSSVMSRGGLFGHWEFFKNKKHKRLETPKGIMDSLLAKIPWLQQDTRALIAKDARVFWRDTTQWGQTLVLFGILSIYILNLRHFSQQYSNPFWIHVISFMNLGACSLNLSTLTTRFVYPQFSLEGKRLWIVGMAPLGMKRLIMTKYWFAATAALIITTSLINLSCYMLKLPADRTFFFNIVVAIMSFTLTGMAVGIGALYPNLREDNPGKIVSGFGGTLCLVVSFIYIVATVLLLAGVSHWRSDLMTQPKLWIGFAVFLTYSLCLSIIPIRMGVKRAVSSEI